MVAEHLRGIEGAAEEAPAIRALLGNQQRREGVLPVGGNEERRNSQTAAAARVIVAFDLVEVDAARIGGGGRQRRQRRVRIGVVGRAEAVDALAERDVHLIDAEEAVGPVGIGLEAEAAQAVAREGRRARRNCRRS